MPIRERVLMMLDRMFTVNEGGSPHTCHWHILRARHLIGVVVSNFSTVSNTLCPLIPSGEHGHSAVGLETVRVKGDALLKTLYSLVSNECFRKEVNGGGECGELHVVELKMGCEGVRCLSLLLRVLPPLI